MQLISAGSEFFFHFLGLSATFRGRPLDGEKLSVPNRCIGIVTLEKQQPFSEDEVKTVRVGKKMEEYPD